jgi:cytochrome oxidase Cu insertion factor (SCO1/SenC/PrrC family)
MEYSRKILASLFLAAALLLGSSYQALSVDVGDKAPDFELTSTKGGKIKLSDLKGKNVLINFYVLDFSPT